METRFVLRDYGERFVDSQHGRLLARALKEVLVPGTQLLVIDVAGVSARPLPLHHLLRVARRALQPYYPDAFVHFVGVGANVRKGLLAALLERRDFVERESSADSLRLQVAYPREVVDNETGQTQVIGARRRQMLAVIARDGPHCVWCGLELSFGHPRATLDHVRPYSQNGSNRLANLLLSCVDCNHARRDRPAARWLAICLQAGKDANEELVRQAIKRVKRNRSTRRSVLAARNQANRERTAARS